jgi:hypothetical protein
MTDQIERELSRHKARMARVLDRPLRAADSDGEPLSADRRAYYLDEARELYWNELEWENITGEERLDDGAFTELAFPGFLAFMRGLLLRESIDERGTPADPHPVIVEEILSFLAGRVVTLRAELRDQEPEWDIEQSTRELNMTEPLIDLVLALLYEVTLDERVLLDKAAAD